MSITKAPPITGSTITQGEIDRLRDASPAQLAKAAHAAVQALEGDDAGPSLEAIRATLQSRVAKNVTGEAAKIAFITNYGPRTPPT